MSNQQQLKKYFWEIIKDIILNRLSVNDRFENVEQLFISIENTYNTFQNKKWVSKIIEAKDIKKEIINLSLVF